MIILAGWFFGKEGRGGETEKSQGWGSVQEEGGGEESGGTGALKKFN